MSANDPKPTSYLNGTGRGAHAVLVLPRLSFRARKRTTNLEILRKGGVPLMFIVRLRVPVLTMILAAAVPIAFRPLQ